MPKRLPDSSYFEINPIKKWEIVSISESASYLCSEEVAAAVITEIMMNSVTSYWEVYILIDMINYSIYKDSKVFPNDSMLNVEVLIYSAFLHLRFPDQRL
jgi:hypothetical protein